MSGDSSRDTVMAAVRRAIAGWDAPPPAAAPWPRSTESHAALVDRFVARAESAEAFVSMAADFPGALQRVADILCELEARQVIVSNDAWAAPWDIARLADEIADCSMRAASSLEGEAAITTARLASAGITVAAYGIAQTGTLAVLSGAAGGRVASLLPAVHIALLPTSGIVPGLPEVFGALGAEREFDRTSAVTFITGPSRTADIELTLTIGVHGPRQLFVVLVNDTGFARHEVHG